jgi:hypothetical protein
MHGANVFLDKLMHLNRVFMGVESAQKTMVVTHYGHTALRKYIYKIHPIADRRMHSAWSVYIAGHTHTVER